MQNINFLKYTAIISDFSKSVGVNFKFQLVHLFLIILLIPSKATAAEITFYKKPNEVSIDELNALVFLRNGEMPIFFSMNTVQSISAELRLIKTKFPEVAQINDLNANPMLFSELICGLKPKAIEHMDAILKKAAKDPGNISKDVINETAELSELISLIPDFKALDNIVPINSVNYEFYAPKGLQTLAIAKIKLSYLVNLNAIINVIKPYHDLEDLEAASFMGDSDHIKRSVLSKNRILYRFSQGGGDCPAGCTVWNVYNFDLNPITGEVKKTNEKLDLSNLNKQIKTQ
jgi:hypothetical protein